jgi:hypothetical protein
MKHPRPDIGWYPFWFWNDRLSANEIRWQIGQMKQQGLRGFVLSPRQGLQQPYLSDAFFDLVQVAIDAAIEHGLVVHLYDELPYPSGPAGGEVLLGNPQFFATELVQKAFELEGSVRIELPRGRILNCVAVPLVDGHPQWDQQKDLSSAVGVVLSEDSYQEVGLTSYNRKRYFSNVAVPTLETVLPPGRHRVFVSAQVTVTGHKYYDNFVDVLNPAAVREFLRVTHERYAARFSKYLGNAIHSIFTDETTPTWSACLPGEFQQRMGYDLLPLLPALHDVRHPEHPRVKADLHRLKYELFVESFEKPVADWCRAHGIAYWAEKPLLRLSQLQYSNVPGCDAGHVKAGVPLDLVSRELRMNPRAAASAAYFYGKSAALCECYHSLGWGATLQDLKRLADGLLLHGINCFVPHAFFYSTHNLRKHDAPPSMFFQMPYWKFFGQMVTETEKVLQAFAGTHIDARVLIVDPSPGVPTVAQLESFARAQHLLLANHVDYLIADVDILQSGTIADGLLHVRDLAVELIVVPPTMAMEPSLSAWLAMFEGRGGKVIRLAETFSDEQLTSRLPEPGLWIDSPAIHVVTRKGAGRVLWFLQNTTSQEVIAEICPQEAGLRTKSDVAIGNSVRSSLRLSPHESILLTPQTLRRNVPSPTLLELPSEWQVQPLNENLLPLRQWQMTLMHDDGTSQSAPVIPAPILHQLTQGQFRFAPQVQRPFGATAALRLPLLRVKYECDFQSSYAGPVRLVMEPGSLAGDWKLKVNDHLAGSFAPVDAHIRGSLGVEITALLKPGSNRVTIELQTDRFDGGLLNCLYLAGDFGVQLEPLGTFPRGQTGGFGEWERNGLPFYSGVVEYRGTFQATGDERIVQLPLDENLLGDDAYEVSFNGGDWHSVPFSPRWIELAAGELRAGTNEICLRVYTTLLRAFEGQRFDVRSHRAVDVLP